MLISLLINCLSGLIHTGLRLPQLQFNLCPAIVHLFNRLWGEERRKRRSSLISLGRSVKCKFDPLCYWPEWWMTQLYWKQSTTGVWRISAGHQMKSLPIKINFPENKRDCLMAIRHACLLVTAHVIGLMMTISHSSACWWRIEISQG